MQTRTKVSVNARRSDPVCRAIKAKGVRAVARLAGLSPTSVSRWASGDIWLSNGAVDRIKAALK